MVVHLETVFSDAAAPILRHITSSLKPFVKSRSHVLLFSISPAPSLPADELSQLVSHFQALQPERVGCLFTPAPLSNPTRRGYAGTSCAVAVFDRKTATPFRSGIPGKETAQVGRWHALRKREEHVQSESDHMTGQDVNWEQLWARKNSGHALPAGLEALRPGDVNTILYFSDNSPEGLVDSLSAFRGANQLGLIAASTPFVTGRPFTLFNNDDILSTGAVGVSLHAQTSPVATVYFPLLTPVTGKLTVTQAEGNLIHTLNNENPSRLLVRAIQDQSQGSKAHEDDKYFVAVCDSNEELKQVYTILSGDPSRGSIALEGENTPEQGTTIRIYRLPVRKEPLHVLTPKGTDMELEVLTTAPGSSLECDAKMDSECMILYNKFHACTENGFVVTRQRFAQEPERPWRSTVLGGQAKLRWS